MFLVIPLVAFSVASSAPASFPVLDIPKVFAPTSSQCAGFAAIPNSIRNQGRCERTKVRQP